MRSSLATIAFGLTVAISLIAGALDVAGRILEGRVLWVMGAHLAVLALCGGLILGAAWLVARLARRTPGRGGVCWLTGLLLVMLGRHLRGAAAVAPDPPLIMASLIGSAFLAAALLRRRKASALGRDLA